MKKFDNLMSRRAIPMRTLLAAREQYEDLMETEDVRYLFGAMEALDADYTKKSLVEAERVHQHLEAFATVRLQGSIKTNTHIRYHSDVDILAITPEFITWAQVPANTQRYDADPLLTLRELRKNSKSAVMTQFPAVLIEEKDRALRLSGGSLKRNLDLVAANWYNTASYAQSNLERDRGIQILDVKANSRVLNQPFLHEYLLNNKNTLTSGGFGRAVRLLKTLKVDSEAKIDISSYDIAALVWNMGDGNLPGNLSASLQLADKCSNFLFQLISNEGALLNTLYVPNKTRKIIDQEGTSLVAVRILWHELYQLLENIKREGKALDRQYGIANRKLQAY